MQKQKRHALIIQLVSTRCLSTQNDLIEALKEHQVNSTQSSISRDIRELGLIKVCGQYQSPQHQPILTTAVLDGEQRKYIQKIDIVSAHLIVIKTQAATANVVAAALDRLAWPEIAGTIAGDDTIFVAVRSEKQAKSVVRRLHQST